MIAKTTLTLEDHEKAVWEGFIRKGSERGELTPETAGPMADAFILGCREIAERTWPKR